LFIEDIDGQALWIGENGSVVLHYSTAAFAPEVVTTASTDHFGAPIVVYRLLLRALRRQNRGDATLVFHCSLNATPAG
jgi:hypothetical protein